MLSRRSFEIGYLEFHVDLRDSCLGICGQSDSRYSQALADKAFISSVKCIESKTASEDSPSLGSCQLWIHCQRVSFETQCSCTGVSRCAQQISLDHVERSSVRVLLESYCLALVLGVVDIVFPFAYATTLLSPLLQLSKDWRAQGLRFETPLVELADSLKLCLTCFALEFALKVVFWALAVKSAFPLEIVFSSVLVYFVWELNCIDHINAALPLFLEGVASGWSQVISGLSYSLGLVANLFPLDALIFLIFVTLLVKLIIHVSRIRISFSLLVYEAFVFICTLLLCALVIWGFLFSLFALVVWDVLLPLLPLAFWIRAFLEKLDPEDSKPQPKHRRDGKPKPRRRRDAKSKPPSDAKPKPKPKRKSESREESLLDLKTLTGARLAKFIFLLRNKKARELAVVFASLVGMDVSCFGDLNDPTAFRCCSRQLMLFYHPDKIRHLSLFPTERDAREEISKVIGALIRMQPTELWT